jgi:hypothetical protein
MDVSVSQQSIAQSVRSQTTLTNSTVCEHNKSYKDHRIMKLEGNHPTVNDSFTRSTVSS